MEQAPVNDNGLDWSLSGPDEDGNVWMEWNGEGQRERFNLGAFDQVAEAIAEWLAACDFGERA
jgi:hypothetical protein